MEFHLSLSGLEHKVLNDTVSQIDGPRRNKFPSERVHLPPLVLVRLPPSTNASLQQCDLLECVACGVPRPPHHDCEVASVGHDNVNMPSASPSAQLLWSVLVVHHCDCVAVIG